MASTNLPQSAAAPALSAKRWLAALVWVAGCYLTARVMLERDVHIALAVVAAIALQAICTVMQSPIWDRYVYDADGDQLIDDTGRPVKRPISVINVGWLIVDWLPNTAGVWYLARGFHTLSPIQMFTEMGLFTVPPLTGWLALLVCGTIALLISATPEKLWHT